MFDDRVIALLETQLVHLSVRFQQQKGEKKELLQPSQAVRAGDAAFLQIE